MLLLLIMRWMDMELMVIMLMMDGVSATTVGDHQKLNEGINMAPGDSEGSQDRE